MINKKQILVLVTVCATFIFIHSLKAQIKNSIYSMFGVGRLIDNSFGINKSLGGTGIAFQSGGSINFLNPASYLGILPNSFNIEIGAYGIFNRSENEYTSQSDGNINVSYFSASLYLKKWWAFCFGVVPFSSIDYEINFNDEIGGELTTFEKTFKGTGGVNRFFMGNSFKVYKGLAVGFNTSCLFGPITQTETAVSNDNFTGYELVDKRTVNGIYLDYGVQYALGCNEWLYTIGFIYGSGKKLNTTNEREFTYNGTTSALEENEQSSIRIPEKFGMGISVEKSHRFRAGFDYEWRNWAIINFSNPNLNTQNSERFSMGVEYFPGQKDSWLPQLYYRLGANYKNSYLKIKNTPIDSKGINFGIGIPRGERNDFNISVEYGEEGTLQKGLIKNRYWVFYLSFSLHEFWIKRPYF